MHTHDELAQKPSLTAEPPASQDSEQLPEGFDPRQFPIIGKHFYGVEPPPPWQHASADHPDTLEISKAT